jgi:single-strand DNA-binding protein
MNTITVVGTLGRDPELRFTAGGQAVVSFSVADTRRWKNNQGEQQEATTWIDVSAWQSLAEHCAASLTKGSRVTVTGRLESREYEAKDGTKRTAYQIVAEAVGPDLRFATVQVEKVQRDTPRANRAPDPVFGDEEPF